MADRIQIRRDTKARWADLNPILAAGEPGFEIDNNRLKIGNGITAWNSLPYVTETDWSTIITQIDTLTQKLDALEARVQELEAK